VARRTHIVSWTSIDPLFIVDDDRRYVHVNAPGERLLATTRDDIVGRRIDDFTPAGRLPSMRGAWRRLQRVGCLEGEDDVLRADGSIAHFRFRAGRDVAPGHHLIIARHLGATPPPGAQPLTRREREVLQTAAAGGSIQEIADGLVVSPATVKTHLEHAYAKLGVRGRAAAVATALRRGLID
jgi:DNA-binding CsgD family transcriptional regulator